MMCNVEIICVWILCGNTKGGSEKKLRLLLFGDEMVGKCESHVSTSFCSHVCVFDHFNYVFTIILITKVFNRDVNNKSISLS